MNTPSFSNWLAQLSTTPGLFMTGTDTGVGKTWIGVRLLQHLSRLGLHITPRKPVESGWSADQVNESDSWKLATCATGFQALHRICPNPLRAPLSPPRAAQQEGKVLTIAQLAQQCRAGCTANSFLYVEGAGGFYSPLAHDGLNADLAQQLQLPVLLVSEDRVGCINQVLLSVQAIEQRGLSLAGVILNPRTSGPAAMDNLTDLRQWLDAPVWRWSSALSNT